MECSFGIIGKDYVLIASDSTASRSIVKMKSDEDKIKTLSPHLLMAYSGEPGDTIQFAEFVERNIRLHHMRTHAELRPASAASWIRRSLAQSLRSRNPYSVNLLLGGFDVPSGKPHLHWIDYLGTLATVPYAAHGYGAYFALATLDAHWEEEMERERGVEVLKMCLNEVKKRLVVDLGEVRVRLVDKDGVHDIKLGEY
ncbi:20s proteasome subunit [Phaffia rhodozyma]|uniref:Proteasome subunit beta n=1 Tax=Phaffia rhodozyma TaxID=264483 RepID=A0A0F7SKV3_PHARH|nr:20s proteasome subunit [Phaffia rhodozyma]